jgi:hypothetical protein
MLRNPYLVAGLAVAAAIVLAVIVVVLSGGGGGGATDGGDFAVAPLTPAPGSGLLVPSIATANVREGPSTEYVEIAVLPSGRNVDVVGRNAEATWFQIVYPPQSQFKGWVPASALRVPSGSVNGIPIVPVTPIDRPTVIVPTSTPEPTETPSPTPTATVTPGGGIDLKIEILNSNCQAGSPLVVMVTNVGSAPTGNREVQVSVIVSGQIVGTSRHSISLEPGGPSVNLPTNQAIQPPRTGARLDILGTPQDVNLTNNAIECVVQGGGNVPPPIVTGTPSPTRTPRRGDD